MTKSKTLDEDVLSTDQTWEKYKILLNGPTYSLHMTLDEHVSSFSRSSNINSLNFTLINKGFLMASFQKWIKAWYQG